MKTLCLIPARGGSKRIPRKNVRPLRGRPIIGYPISAALAAGCFDEVMVSTDDAEIAAVARAHGAAVPFLRSAATSGDHASTAAVVSEVLAAYARRERKEFDIICCLYPTAALVRPGRLQEGLGALLADGELDTAMSVQAFAHPIERAFRLSDGTLVPVDPTVQQMRTQDLRPAYHDAGQFYFFRSAGLIAWGRMVGPRCAPVMLSAWEAVDLDHESDWAWLERLLPTEAAVA